MYQNVPKVFWSYTRQRVWDASLLLMFSNCRRDVIIFDKCVCLKIFLNLHHNICIFWDLVKPSYHCDHIVIVGSRNKVGYLQLYSLSEGWSWNGDVRTFCENKSIHFLLKCIVYSSCSHSSIIIPTRVVMYNHRISIRRVMQGNRYRGYTCIYSTRDRIY